MSQLAGEAEQTETLPPQRRRLASQSLPEPPAVLPSRVTAALCLCVCPVTFYFKRPEPGPAGNQTEHTWQLAQAPRPRHPT